MILLGYTVLVAGASNWILEYHLQIGKFTSLLNPFPPQKNDSDNICPHTFWSEFVKVWMKHGWKQFGHKFITEELLLFWTYLITLTFLFLKNSPSLPINTCIIHSIIMKFKEMCIYKPSCYLIYFSLTPFKNECFSLCKIWL